VLEAIELFGAYRCMLASDFPTDRPFGSFDDTLDAYAGIIAVFSDSERHALWGGNASQVYRLGLQLSTSPKRLITTPLAGRAVSPGHSYPMQTRCQGSSRRAAQSETGDRVARINGTSSAAASVARSIADDIMSGRREPGSRLPVEADLAELLGVGRSTVREAVKTLASKGLLEVATRRGTIVRPAAEWHQLDPHLIEWRLKNPAEREPFLRHLSEIRGAFEPFAASLAAMRRTDADVTAIYRALADMREADPETIAAAQADLLFHNAIAYAARNPLLTQLAKMLEPALMHTFDITDLGLGDVYRANIALHQDIADAIARNDADRAAAVTRTLIAKAERDRTNDTVPTGR
jgi:DNA-binding FadR family transcriptional regulator